MSERSALIGMFTYKCGLFQKKNGHSVSVGEVTVCFSAKSIVSPSPKSLLVLGSLRFVWVFPLFRASLIAQLVKNPPTIQETPLQFLGQENVLGEGIGYPLQYSRTSLVAQLVKNPPTMWETWV